jgi:hypothetical protein
MTVAARQAPSNPFITDGGKYLSRVPRACRSSSASLLRDPPVGFVYLNARNGYTVTATAKFIGL